MDEDHAAKTIANLHERIEGLISREEAKRKEADAELSELRLKLRAFDAASAMQAAEAKRLQNELDALAEDARTKATKARDAVRAKVLATGKVSKAKSALAQVKRDAMKLKREAQPDLDRLATLQRRREDAVNMLQISFLADTTREFARPKKNCMSCGAEFQPAADWDKVAKKWTETKHQKLCPKCSKKATSASAMAHNSSGDTGGKVN